MKKKLNCIMLIDDDDATTFLYKIILNGAKCTEHIQIAQGGSEALDYLNQFSSANVTKDIAYFPELIFVDINMPSTNGWEFLEKYKDLKKKLQKDPVVFMLSTSLNPDDETRATTIPEVSGFRHKPLSVPMLNEILANHFKENF